MNYLVLGAGMMGRVAAMDLALDAGTDEVVLADQSRRSVQEAAHWLSLPNVVPMRLDVESEKMVMSIMRKADCVVSAVPYRLNAKLAELAVKAGSGFCDLGGNNDVVARELALSRKAERAEVAVVPNCGLAPGLACVLGHYGFGRVDGARSVHMRVGGLPQHPRPPLNYKLLFSPYGLINEYVEPAVAIRKGRIVTRDSMADLEELSFPKPFGKMEAFNTSGGTSMLPQLLEGKASELDYKTIRYPGHCEIVRAMLGLGFAGHDKVEFDGKTTTRRELFAALLADTLVNDDTDVTLMRVVIESARERLTYQMIDRYDEELGITSMARTTAYPTSIAAMMVARGEVEPGARTMEACIDGARLVDELGKRGVEITERRERL